ncbi:hypothetical protein GDO81_021589, partial [Engystomops pustulosus]
SPASAELVTGVLGGHVVLPCAMKKSQVEAEHRNKYPTSRVHWRRKDRFPGTVHRLLPSGVSYTSRPAWSRASVPQSLIDQGVFSLHLRHLKERDAGTYGALVEYGESRQECRVTLRTIQLTQFPQSPVPESSSVTLKCHIVSTDLSVPSIGWLHDGNPVRPSRRISMKGDSLHIPSLALGDHGKWSCEVNGARSDVTLLVVGLSGPDPLPVYTAIGSSLKLPCNITYLPAERLLRFHWSKDQRKINDNKQALVFHHVNREDAGTYRCETTYKDQKLTRLIELKVIQVSPWAPVLTKEGSHLQLLCNISGSAGKEQYQWSGPFLQDGQRKVIQGAMVDLPHVAPEDSGAWTCSLYGKNGILGAVDHWVYVQAAQTSDVGYFTWWHVLLLLLIFALISCLVVIAFISFRNHKRRLSHLTALTALAISSDSEPQKPWTSG